MFNLSRNSFFQVAIGCGAFWYLATYTWLSGSLAAAPLLLTGLLASLFFLIESRGRVLQFITFNELLWPIALVAFGGWSLFSVWYFDGPGNVSDAAAKFLLGGLVALGILRFGVNIDWVKAGACVGTIAIAWVVLTQYNGGRFSPFMNATKWGNALAFQSLLMMALAVLEKNIWLKLLFLLSSIANVYFVMLTGTRGAFLPILAFVLLLVVVYGRQLSVFHILCAVVTLVVILFVASSQPIVKSRLAATVNSFQQMSQDNFNTSIGYRITMWSVGAQAAIDHPVMGAGYDYKQTMLDYRAPTPGLRKSADSIASSDHSQYHSAYVDAAATRGITGLILLVAMILCGLWSRSRQHLIYIAPAVLGVASAGLSDSALTLGITTTYFILAGTLFKAVRFT